MVHTANTHTRAIESALQTERQRLLAHCYRLLGSPADAEDALQNTLTKAWLARESFDGRASPGTWLHAIATRCCLDELRKRPHRAIPAGLGVEMEHDGALPWLGPLLDPDPSARFERNETVSLAFAALLQTLSPKQRAALVLADVLDWSAAEIAETLGTSVPAVRSVLLRARSAMKQRVSPIPAPDDARTRALAERLVFAWERADAAAMAEVLADEAVLSMPPEALHVSGRAAVSDFFARTVWPERSWRLQPVRANGTLAFAVWVGRSPDTLHPHALMVAHLDREGAVSSLVSFRDPDLLTRSGLHAP